MSRTIECVHADCEACTSRLCDCPCHEETEDPVRRGELFTVPGTPPIEPVPHDAPWPPPEPGAAPTGGEIRLLTLGDMLPISLVVPVLQAVDEAMQKQGYEAYFKDSTGMGVMWVRKRKA